MLNRRSFLKVTTSAAVASAVIPSLSFADKLNQKLDQLGRPSLERPEAIFIYHRMGFGPTAQQLTSPEPFRFERYVESQLYPEKIKDEVCEQKLKDAKLESISKSLKDCWKDYKVAADENGGKNPNKKNENDIRLTPIREVEMATWIRALYSEKQLQELVVQFWHDHFSVNGWDGSISPTMPHYDRDVIRKHAFGNFQEMVKAVTQSPAMLLYLDNGLNQSANPNENFARELFELHTLGAENYLGTLDRKKVFGYTLGKSKGYVDGDVYESARAFTGWRENSNQKDATNTGEFNYYEAWHDRFQKIVLGHEISEYQPPEKDGLDVIALVSQHEGTAHAICKKLCKRLVSDEPSEALILKAKKAFVAHRKDPDQIRKVLRVILLSSDFRDPKNYKLKRPFEYTVALLRGLGHFNPDADFMNRQNAGGQRLFQWKTPDGYPEQKERWMTASGLLYRFQLANFVLDHKLLEMSEFGHDESPVPTIQKRVLGYTTKTQTQVMDAFIKDHLKPNAKTYDPPGLKGSVLLALMSPELQWK